MMHEQQFNIAQEDNIAHEDNSYLSEEDFQANRHTEMLDGETNGEDLEYLCGLTERMKVNHGWVEAAASAASEAVFNVGADMNSSDDLHGGEANTNNSDNSIDESSIVENAEATVENSENDVNVLEIDLTEEDIEI
jgi:hypothetical protein